MRTTVTLQDDVAAAVEARRRESGEGLSEALNGLVRAGLVHANARRKPFVQKTARMGWGNADNVAEALERLDGWDQH